jgi:hypothetical protein
MPHKFDFERWNYFEMPHNGGATIPTRQDNMKLTIPREDGQVDEDRSNQGPFRKIDGTATDTTLDLVATDEVRRIKRTLNGKVIVEETVNGVLHVVIVGRFKNDPLPGFTEEDRGGAAAAQNEGTWVITKP